MGHWDKEVCGLVCKETPPKGAPRTFCDAVATSNWVPLFWCGFGAAKTSNPQNFQKATLLTLDWPWLYYLHLIYTLEDNHKAYSTCLLYEQWDHNKCRYAFLSWNDLLYYHCSLDYDLNGHENLCHYSHTLQQLPLDEPYWYHDL